MSSDRVRRLLALGDLPYTTGRALVRCLSPEEKAEALPATLEWHYKVREELAKAFTEDALVDLADYHEAALAMLVVLLEGGSPRIRRSAAYALTLTQPVWPKPLGGRILKAFLADKSAHIRDRGFRLLNAHWDGTLESFIAEAWRTRPNTVLATVIANNFPVSFLDEYKETVAAQLRGRWALGRLIKRLVESGRNVGNLRESEPVSYLYACAKCKRQIDDIDVVNAIDRASENPDLFGLVVWCLGRLGRWNDLEMIHVQHAGEEYINPWDAAALRSAFNRQQSSDQKSLSP